MYLFLKSDDSKELYAQNNASRFKVKLPGQLDLTRFGGCGLTELLLPSVTDNSRAVYVGCSLVTDSIVGTRTLPVLRKLNNIGDFSTSRVYERVYYIPLKRQEASEIEVFIMSSQWEDVRFSSESVTHCVLHLIKA